MNWTAKRLRYLAYLCWVFGSIMTVTGATSYQRILVDLYEHYNYVPDTVAPDTDPKEEPKNPGNGEEQIAKPDTKSEGNPSDSVSQKKAPSNTSDTNADTSTVNVPQPINDTIELPKNNCNEPYFKTAYRTLGRYKNKKIRLNETNINELKGVIEGFKNSIDCNIEVSKSYDGIGRCHNLLQNYNDAIVAFTEAIKFNETYALAYYNRGHSKAEMKDCKGTLEDFSKAISLLEDNNSEESQDNLGELLHLRAQIYFVKENYNDAVSDCYSSIKMGYKIESNYFLLGQCYVKLGKQGQASSALAKTKGIKNIDRFICGK